MSTDGNGVTRREFEELKRTVEALERALIALDRDGSAESRRLGRQFDRLDGTVAWIIRGFIASIGLALLAWVVIQGQGP